MAAIFVITRHTENYWHFSFYRSYLAVDLFFILSGFVIAYAYDEKIKNGTITFSKFFLIRLIRLYPVFLLSLFFSCVLLVLYHQIHYSNLTQILSVVAFTALFIPSHMAGRDDLFALNGPYWSLFFELIANLIYAAIRPLLTDSVLTSIVLLFGILITGVAYQQGNLSSGFEWGMESLIAGFSRSIFGVFLGLFLYRRQLQFAQYFKNPNAAWLSFFAILIVLSSPDAGRLNWVVDVFCVAIVFPIVVLCAAQGKSAKLQGFLLMLGSASYPIYVLHLPVAAILAIPFHAVVEKFVPISGVVLVLVLVALSLAVEKYYDIPIRRRISDFLFKKSALSAVPAKS